ncbi:protein of unknown function (plasmid) [Caballeronia sp. S22]
MYSEQLLREMAILQNDGVLRRKVVPAGDFPTEILDQCRRKAEGLEGIRLVGARVAIMYFPLRHDLNRAACEQKGFAPKRLMLHTAGNQCDVTVEMIMGLELKRRKLGGTEDQSRDMAGMTVLNFFWHRSLLERLSVSSIIPASA